MLKILSKGLPVLILLCVSSCGKDIKLYNGRNTCTIYGGTPLMEAVVKKDVKAVSSLISGGDDVNALRNFETRYGTSGISIKGKIDAFNLAIELCEGEEWGDSGQIALMIRKSGITNFYRGGPDFDPLSLKH